MNNDKAVTAFLVALEVAREILATLTEYTDQHMDVCPDSLTWANVGDANRMVSALKEVHGMFGGLK